MNTSYYNITIGNNTCACVWLTHVPVFGLIRMVNMFHKRVILWRPGLHTGTEKCRVYKFSGPD